MYTPLLIKYNPTKLDDFNIDNFTKDLINTYIKHDKILFLIQGNNYSGKSSLINVILNIYYNYSKKEINDNTIYINLLKEQGINYYRNEIKNYCQIYNFNNKIKKTIILDDLDILNEQCQQIFSTLINKYEDINFIISCNDIQKIKSNIIHKFEVIKIDIITNEYLLKLLNNILFNENISLCENTKLFLIKSSNYSISNMINIIEKIKIIGYDYIDSIEKIICNILINEFNTYIELCKNNNFIEAMNFILNIHDTGYSVIDILDEFFIYIKNYSNLSDKYKYEITKLLCKYINIFYNIHEDSIELIFLTNNIIYIFKDIS